MVQLSFASNFDAKRLLGSHAGAHARLVSQDRKHSDVQVQLSEISHELSSISNVLHKLTQQSNVMGKELTAHGAMLYEINDKVEITASSVTSKQEDISRIIKQNNPKGPGNMAALLVETGEDGRKVTFEKDAGFELVRNKGNKCKVYSVFVTGLDAKASVKQILAAFPHSVNFEYMSAISVKLNFKTKSAATKALEFHGMPSNVFWRGYAVVKKWNPAKTGAEKGIAPKQAYPMPAQPTAPPPPPQGAASIQCSCASPSADGRCGQGCGAAARAKAGTAPGLGSLHDAASIGCSWGSPTSPSQVCVGTGCACEQ